MIYGRNIAVLIINVLEKGKHYYIQTSVSYNGTIHRTYFGPVERLGVVSDNRHFQVRNSHVFYTTVWNNLEVNEVVRGSS